MGWDGGGGGGEGVYMSSQCSAECRSRRRMLIQLYGSCSLVPMATVFALEQKSCISSLAIKDHCQARERGLPATKSHQHYCKELLMLIFGTTQELSDAAVEDLLCFSPYFGSTSVHCAFFWGAIIYQSAWNKM